MLKAGDLNRRIRVQRRGTAQDESGQPIDDWQDVWSGWAQVAAITSGTARRYSNAGFTSQVSHMVSVRWRRDGVARQGDRVVQDGSVFEVQQISNPDGGRERLDLFCQEVNGGILADADGRD